MTKYNFRILYINTYGQTKMTMEKQLQIQDILKHKSCDIIHLQEVDFDGFTFENCHFILNNYNIITNNSQSGYGTASLVKNEFNVENVLFDTEGRVSNRIQYWSHNFL